MEGIASAFDFLLGDWEVEMQVIPEGAPSARVPRCERTAFSTARPSSTNGVTSIRQEMLSFEAPVFARSFPAPTTGMSSG